MAGQVEIVLDTSLYVRLAEGVDQSGQLNQMAQQRAFWAIAQLLEKARELRAEQVRAVATSAVRDASNRDDFLNRAAEELGLEIEVLTGEQESRLSYAAVALDPILGTYTGEQIIADVGGGSTEITYGRGRTVSSSVSLNVGAVRLTEKFLAHDPPTPEEVEAAREWTDDILRHVNLGGPGRLVGVGGSAVNLARIYMQVTPEQTQAVHGAYMGADAMRELADRLTSMSVQERRALIGLDPDRADIIPGGAIVLERAMTVLQVDEMVTSIRGLRHGVLYEMLLRQ